MIRLILAAALLALLAPLAAHAQSTPNWPLHYVPTPAEWNAAWMTKADTANPVITGMASFTGAGTGLAVTNNTTIGGRLGVTSTVAYSGTPNVGGNFPSTQFKGFLSGALTAGQQGFVNISLIGETVAGLSSGSALSAIQVQHTIATGATGNRWMVDVASTAAVASTDMHLGGYRSTIIASASMGGTGLTPGLAKGNLFGANFVAQAASGATNLSGVAGQEIDVQMATGSSAAVKIGLGIVQTATDAVQAATADDDQALSFNNQSLPIAGTGWLSLIGVGRFGGFAPLDPVSGWIMTVTAHVGAGTVAAAGGLDFTNLTPVTAFLRGNGFLLDPSGVMTAAGFKVGATAGVTCAPGAPTASFAASNGIVTHC